jgi:putative phosphoesterase
MTRSRAVASAAVLSDIHGVLAALEAVLTEPDVTAVDRIVLTGDIAAGPQPVAVLDRLSALGDRVVWVRGNADRELVTLARGGDTTIPDPIAPWAARQLTAGHLERLGALPHPVTLDLAGFGPVLFCHGTPRDDEEVVLVDTRMERWADVLSGVDPSVSTIVCGHTHMPFQRLAHRRLVVNPGSVGMPYGRPGAHWALLRDGVVHLRTSSYDVESACAEIVATGYPDAAAWADFFIRSPASDARALATFAPRDGRDATVRER